MRKVSIQCSGEASRGLSLELVFCGDASSGGLVLGLVLLGVVDHALNLLLRQTSLVVRDGDLLATASGLVCRTDVQNTVGVLSIARKRMGLDQRVGRRTMSKVTSI